MSILGVKPVVNGDLPSDAPKGRAAERILSGELLQEMRYLSRTQTEMLERLAPIPRSINHVLEVGTRVFDSTGVIFLEYNVAASCIQVENQSTAVASTTTNNQASNTFSAAAAGSVALPTNGEYITGFDVNFLSASPSAVSGIITVTNVAGGTISYEIGVGTGGAGTDLSIRYPFPLPASGTGVAPTVNVPAMTGGPAYSIAVYGQTVTAATSAHNMTISSAAPTGTAPATGVGTYVVPAGATRTVAVASRTIAIYGTQGDTVSYQVFTRAISPVSS